MANEVKWLWDVDIAKVFDPLAQARLRAFLPHRVREGVRTRLSGPWLTAGVLEQGARHYREAGTPQGGSASPLLRNVSLQDVLAPWVAQAGSPRLRGRAVMLRVADDVVLGLARKEEAEKVWSGRPKRFGTYGRTLHPDTTRLGACGRPRGLTGGKPGTFDCLGVTHDWGQSRRGQWIIKPKTARQRLRRGLQRIAAWCRHTRHRPVAAQHKERCQKLRGPFAYDGITGNGLWVQKCKQGVRRIWQQWLHRWSRSSTDMPWDRYPRLLERSRRPPARVVPSIYAAKP